MLEELVARTAVGARVVVIGAGAGAAEAAAALRERDCEVIHVAHPDAALAEGPFDLALVGEFREDWQHPRHFLRRLRSSLRGEGRVLVSRAGAGAAAVRVAVYGESEGESVAPVLREVDLVQFAAQALGELLAVSGYRVRAGAFDAGWIEGAVPSAEVTNGDRTHRSASNGVRTDSESAATSAGGALAEAELRELREFVGTVLDRQRRLHEELARLRAAVASRDESLATMRTQLDDALGAVALAPELRARLETAERRLAEAEAQIADLDARRLRLAATVLELRER